MFQTRRRLYLLENKCILNSDKNHVLFKIQQTETLEQFKTPFVKTNKIRSKLIILTGPDLRAGFNYNFEKLRLECKLVGTEKIGHERVAKITQVSALKFAKFILLFGLGSLYLSSRQCVKYPLLMVKTQPNLEGWMFRPSV